MITPLFPQFIQRLAAMGPRSSQKTLRRLRQATLSQIEQRLGAFLPVCALQNNRVKEHSRERLYPLRRVFWSWIWQVLQANTACREVVRQIQMIFCLHGQVIHEGTSAYCQSRRKIPLALLQRFIKASADAAQKLVPRPTLLQGRPLKALDGSSVRLADTRPNQKAFPQPHSQRRGAGFPIMKIVSLFCISTGAVLDCITGHRFQSDVSLAAQMFAGLIKGDIVVADRGFGSFVMAALLQRLGIDLIARVPTTIRHIDFRKGRRLGHKEALFVWRKPKVRSPWMRVRDWLLLPDALTLRVLQVRVSVRNQRVKTLTLATTLLDSNVYPVRELAEAYRLRWRLEMCFDDLKTTLHMAHLKSKTPTMAKKELSVFLIAHNLLRCVIAQAATEAQIPVRQISFKGTLDGFRQCAYAIAQATSRIKRGALWDQFKQSLINDAVPHRPERREPRAVKRIIKYPKLNSYRHRFKDRLSRNKRRSLRLVKISSA
jgi:putative transposase